eukprot:Sdes_comp20252_c0_seq1m13704
MQKIYYFGFIYFLVVTVYWETLHFQQAHPSLTFWSLSLQQISFLSVVPLSFLDATLFWWIFRSLSALKKTLEIRRQSLKLDLYRKFSRLLIFCFVSSLLFAIFEFNWKLKIYKTHLQPGQNSQSFIFFRWMDVIFWKALFLLMTIFMMVLWRPTKNHHQYAYSPLKEDFLEDQGEPSSDMIPSNFSTLKLRNLNHSNHENAHSVDENANLGNFSAAKNSNPVTAIFSLDENDDEEEETERRNLELNKLQ